MTSATVRDLCQVRHGGTPSKSIGAYWEGDIPWVSPKDMKLNLIFDASDHISEHAVANSATSLVPKGAILVVVRSGILAHSLPVARVGRPVAFNQDIKALIPDPQKVDPEYLYWFIRSKASDLIARGVKKGATVHSLISGCLEGLEVPLPSRDRQTGIVDLLSRAEGIVRLRHEAQAKAQAIIPALFLETFGNPESNPKGWPLRPVRDIVARFEGGKNLQAGSEGGSRYQILKVSAVTSGNYIEAEKKPAPECYEPPKSHLVRAGDMLFSRANTQALVGATAIVESTDGRTLLPDKLWRFVWSEAIDQNYMHALFQNQHIRRELGKLSTGTSASMRNISQEKLYQLRLPIAPIELQTAFGEQVEALQSVSALQRKAVKLAIDSFNSILARAFRGDLRIS